MATKTAAKLGDYAVTEAGFGADLGAEKFLDIKSRAGDINPSAVVIVATVRALKMHGGVHRDHLKEENIQALEAGMDNLKKHMETIDSFGLPFVVAINQFPTDTKAETDFVKSWCESHGADVALTDVMRTAEWAVSNLLKKLWRLPVLLKENRTMYTTPMRNWKPKYGK